MKTEGERQIRNRQMDKEDVVHTHTEYRSDKNEVMPFAATWMNLEVILLSEVRRRKTNTV